MSSIKLKHSGGNSVSLNPPTSAPTSSEVAFKLPTSDGSAGQVLMTDGSGNLSWVTQPTAGITMADQWRINADFTNNGANLISSNWERNDTTGFTGIGSAMTQSSGTFSFPSTGIYYIQFNGRGAANNGARQYAGVYIQTGISGSYTTAADNYTSVSASGYFFACTTSTIFDVTDTSTHTVRFYAESSGDCIYHGDTGSNRNHVTFLRLGDT